MYQVYIHRLGANKYLLAGRLRSGLSYFCPELHCMLYVTSYPTLTTLLHIQPSNVSGIHYRGNFEHLSFREVWVRKGRDGLYSSS